MATRLNFNCLENSGALNGHTNQCMFISILHYLKYVEGNETVTLEEIRQVGQLNPDTKHTQYDFADKRFKNCLDLICTHYNISIKIYRANKYECSDHKDHKDHKYHKWLGNSQEKFGTSSRTARIVYFGNHFELLTKIGKTVLYEIKNLPPSISQGIYKKSKTEKKSTEEISDPIVTASNTTMDLSDPSNTSVSEQTCSDITTEIEVVLSSELEKKLTTIIQTNENFTKTVEYFEQENAKLKNRLFELNNDFFRKKEELKSTRVSKEVLDRKKAELESIKMTSKQILEQIKANKDHISKINLQIHENADTAHKL